MRYIKKKDPETGKDQWYDSHGNKCDDPNPDGAMDYGSEYKGKIGNRGWPMHCEASGCHPSQVQAMEKHMTSLGVPTRYTPDGKAILTDRRHRKRALEVQGYHDKNAGYGDPTPK